MTPRRAAPILAVLTLVSLVLVSPPIPAAAAGGGGDNVVIAVNRTDGRFAMQANLHVDRIPGPVAAPLNLALASSSCTDCQTLAVAIQLDLASSAAGVIAPRNVAVATNAGCLRCVTVARAVQVFYTVDDPTAIPASLAAAMRDLDLALHRIAADPAMTLPQAEAQVDAVIAGFLAASSRADDRRTVAAP